MAKEPKRITIPINNPAQPKPTNLPTGSEHVKQPRDKTTSKDDSIPVPLNPTPAPPEGIKKVKKQTKNDVMVGKGMKSSKGVVEIPIESPAAPPKKPAKNKKDEGAQNILRTAYKWKKAVY